MEDQDVDMAADADTIGVEVVARWSDGKAASQEARERNPNLVREDWDEVQDAIGQRFIDMLILWEASRGDRDAREWLSLLDLCARQGVLIRITKEHFTYDPRITKHWEMLAYEGIKSQVEIKQLTERSRRGVAGSLRRRRPRNQIPFGYMREYDETTRRVSRQVPDEREREAVAADGSVTLWTPAGVMRDLYAGVKAGDPLRELARRLNAAGVPTPRQMTARTSKNKARIAKTAHMQWCAEAIGDMLARPAYAGHLVNGRVMVPVKGRLKPAGDWIIAHYDAWDGLVSQDLFDEVNGIIRDPDRRTSESTEAKHLSSGVARCKCGGRLGHFGPNPKRRTTKPTYQCLVNCCVGILADKLDQFLTGQLIEWLSRPKNLDLLRRNDRLAGARVAEARAEVLRLDGKLKAHIAKADDPNFVMTDSHGRHEIALKKALADAERNAKAMVGVPALRELVAAPDVAEAWKKMTQTRRRAALRALMEPVVLPAGRGKRLPVEQRVQIRWRLGGSV